MALIFIAIPTKGTITDGKLNEQFLMDLANLHLKFPDHTFLSPMVQDYQLLKFLPSSTATWDDWGRHCRVLIERCDEVWVLTYEGYAESVGVRGEVEHAMKHNVLIQYINPETI